MSELMMWRRHWEAKMHGFIHPHYATCPTTLRPENINTSLVGEHVSVVFIQGSGVRTYAFEGQKNRDRFVNLYRPHGAKPCGDPLKGNKNASNPRVSSHS
jgi:hypothetical protein